MRATCARSAKTPPINDFVGDFLISFATPVMPKFRLLVKTHKNAIIDSKGSFPSRPLVGLFCWATTPSAIIMVVVGLILVKLDRHTDPDSTPLMDSYDFLRRRQDMMDGSWVCSTFDFDSLYTRITWKDMSWSFGFWQQWVSSLQPEVLSCISGVERTLLDFVFTKISESTCRDMAGLLPFLCLDGTCDSVGLFMLNFVFHSSVFLNPGLGIFRQAQGWSMGTNAAPPWARLSLRAYERLALLPQPSALFRFIDDGFVLHGLQYTYVVVQNFVSIYPASVPYSFDAF